MICNWQSCMYCKKYGNYCGCKEYSPTSLANYSSLWPWAATPPLSHQWLIGGFPVTWSIALVVDSDHMTHLYNSYIVVDITPSPLPSHMTQWLIGHMTYRYSGRRSHDFFSTLLVTWLDDSSVNFRSNDLVICQSHDLPRVPLLGYISYLYPQ